MIFTKKEPETMEKYIVDQLTRNEVMSDESLINAYWVYMKHWNISSIDKKCSSIRRQLRKMRLQWDIIETDRVHRKKGNSKEIFYKLWV